MALEHEEITREIIGAAFEVHRILGYGFLEKVYQKSMGVELEARGLKAKLEDEIHVKYKGVEVGFYKSDLFVNDCVIVEIKAAKEYNSEDESQLLNELKGTGTRVGLLINFGRAKVEFKRFVY
ncbi:MAG TPA: GxxExxY protein [Pirellulales bacterium]|nr:GxxExxY protein [Pirellulales bacterium]